MSVWNDIKTALEAIIEKRVPSKLTSPRFTNPWINTEIRHAIRRKQRAHQKARRTKKNKDTDRYKRLQKEVKFMIRTANRRYIETTIDEAYSSNNKIFWSYIKSKGQESTGIPPLKSKDGFLKSDSFNKAEILNEQFKLVFTEEDLSNIPDKGQNPFQPRKTILITNERVLKFLLTRFNTSLFT